jgi:hypothetical protein
MHHSIVRSSRRKSLDSHARHYQHALRIVTFGLFTKRGSRTNLRARLHLLRGVERSAHLGNQFHTGRSFQLPGTLTPQSGAAGLNFGKKWLCLI